MTASKQTEGSERTGHSVSLHFPCQFRYLALVRQTAIEICQRIGMSEFKCYQFEMAIDEACTNVIEHSYGGESTVDPEADPGFFVLFEERDNRVEAVIIDHGKGFNFTDHPVNTPEQYLSNHCERGLGMYIISQFVDDVEYHQGTQAGNRLRLTKRI